MASGFRIHLLEPSTGVASGGTHIVVHGKGFRPQPHSLLVRFRLAETGARVEVSGRFLLETQLECVVPSFQDDARSVIARATALAPTSATVALAPHLVVLQVEVIMDSERISNPLSFSLHQGIAIAKITPQFVLMTPPTTVTATLNLLKLSTTARLFPPKDKPNTGAHELAEISSLPVFVRVRQVSERTGTVSERTVDARWRVSPVGVYEVEFDAVMMTFGDATVELTLNRSDFFRAKDKTPDAVGYCVHRDVTLTSIDPCCVSVTSGRATEVRLLGEGFVDSGDLTVRLLQRDIHEWATDFHPVAQLTATFLNQNEILCTIHSNMSFGLTLAQVSLNGGRQYGKDRATVLLHRDRVVESVTPAYASLEGGTLVLIRLARLTVDTVDAPYQIQHLVPPRRLRVKFQAVSDDDESGRPPDELVKVVHAEILPPTTGGESNPDAGVVRCRVPSFLEEVKQLRAAYAAASSGGDTAAVVGGGGRIRRFRLALSLGGDAYFGSLQFACFFPPVIRSMTRHHGPCSGGTTVFLRMKHRVPTQLAIQVRFLSLATRDFEIVPGVVETDHLSDPSRPQAAVNPGSPAKRGHDPMETPAFVIACTTPAWSGPNTAPSLTKVQVSYDGGFNFVPAEEEHELIAAGLASPRSRGIPSQLVKDMSHLYFLFYPVPRLYSVVPMSADIQGGSFIRIGGDQVVDHGGQISVVFQSPQLSRKVVGFIENGELLCCAPPFNVGPAAIFVSFNGDQYTKCEFVDPDSRRAIDFVYYSSPLLQRLSPLCTSISHSSLIHIFGVNLIETGRVKVRFGFTSHLGKLMFKDVPGRAQDGVIMAQSPLFSAEYGNLKAVVDVALNGNDFSGKSLALYYYSSYTIKRVEPPVGAVDIPIPLTISLSQSVVSDALLVRIRFKQRHSQDVTTFGSVPVTQWEGNRVSFVLPAISAFVASLDALESASVDLSFDKVYFHATGELLQYYRVYKLPPVLAVAPLVGHFEQETAAVAKCADLSEGLAVTITLTLDVFDERQSVVVEAIAAETNARRQTLSWKWPPLTKLVRDVAKFNTHDAQMLLPARLGMQISTVSGQLLSLPFRFQYYRMPVLLSMSPRVGYICGGSLISFEFNGPIKTPTVDFRFGATIVTSGRVRADNKHMVECLSPELDAGVHGLAMSFDEQYFDDAFVDVIQDEEDAAAERDDDEGDDSGNTTASIPQERGAATRSSKPVARRTKCAFQAFEMPHFTVPANRHRVYGFGPTEGGSHVVIKGRGFIAEGKIYVRFCSPYADALVGPTGKQAEVIVTARVLDDSTILCASPPATRPGRVLLQVTYNLQQYTDSSCFFEYHERTKFQSRGILCGPVSGGTPVTIQVENPAGLPDDPSLLRSSCALRFMSDSGEVCRDVEAAFDEETLAIQCLAPAWPSNELVSIEVTLSRGAAPILRQFVVSGARFLFYDPPEGLITIEPSAGPVTGGTEVLAWCGKIVDTGEIMVSVTIADDDASEASARANRLASVGEDDGDEEEDEEEEVTASPRASDKEVYLVKGKIVGEAVSFVAPAVSKPGVAYLNIALNGINYTSTQPSTLRYKYYHAPEIQRISPTWCAIDAPCVLVLSGAFIEDHGCKAVVRFLQQQQPQQPSKDTVAAVAEPFLTEGVFVDGAAADAKSASATSRALQCSFQAPHAGFFEIQVSLNGGQQFSAARFMQAPFGNYSGTACTVLLPFRCFASPFLLATPTGSVAGGSTVALFMSKRLSKLLARETKCQVQFAPVKNGGDAGPTPLPVSNASVASPQKTAALTAADGVVVSGEIDHVEGKITCRAPLLRAAGVAALDLLLPPSVTGAEAATASTTAVGARGAASSTTSLVSCTAFFGVKDRERFYAYESPTIIELAPTCGPLSGGTTIVIECSNIVDTGQIFVRFRSSANERECVLVPAAFSRTFPDGSLSASPLLVCQTPRVEVSDRIVVSVSDSAAAPPSSPQRMSSGRDGSTGAVTSKLRAQTFQQMAEQSLRGGLARTLKVTRMVLKNAPAASSTVGVLIDFTMNAGEQFIAHSAPFQFYPDVEPRELKWAPRHLPTRSFDRAAPSETRVVTVQLPKTLRAFTDSASAAERVAFFFEGALLQLFSPAQKRRGSSIVLHETGNARELLVLDAAPAAKLRTQSTMRRRSTYFRNSSISATSNNLLDSSGASLATNATRPRVGVARTGAGGGPRRPSGSFGTAGGGGGGGGGGLSIVSSSHGPVSPPSASFAHTSSPYIAGKILKGGLEVTCPVPEFGGCGSVQVFFSFNAQQFVCLGELFVHEPLVVREDRTHRFTSNIGGDRFVLYCSPSSVFDFLLPQDVLNEEELLRQRRRENGLARASKALVVALSTTASEDAPPDSRGARCPVATAGDEKGESTEWRDRVFHVVQVHVVPPNARLLRKLIVAASSAGSKAELATSSPDDCGHCVFETTDWMTDMMLSIAAPPTARTSSFSTILAKSQFGKHRLDGSFSSSSTTRRTHALLLQLPTAATVTAPGYVGCCFSDSKAVHLLTVVGHSGEVVSEGVEASTVDADGGVQYSLLAFDPPTPPRQAEEETDGDAAGHKLYYWCVELRGSTGDETDELQVVVADASGEQVYLTGPSSSPARPSGLWVVACVYQRPPSSAGSALVEIDLVVNSLSDLATDPVLAQRCSSAAAAFFTSQDRQSPQTPAASERTAVATRVLFACADSSRNLSASAAAQVVLPGKHTFSSLAASGDAPKEFVLQCEMPALPFNGPTILSVQIDGVAFSNSLCVHCYDPRLWQIKRVDPPCGLTLKPLKLRVTGEHFVDNKKALVRFSDATRFRDVSCTMERYHLLVVRIATIRNLRNLLPPHFAAALVASAGGGGGGSSPQRSTQQQQQQQHRDELLLPSGGSPLTVAARVEYRDQVFRATSREGAVLAALSASSSAPPLGWDDQFEVEIPADAMGAAQLIVSLELVELSGARSAQWELGRVVVPVGGLAETVLTKRAYQVDEHFCWRNRASVSVSAPAQLPPSSDVDVFLHLSPQMTRADVFVCDVASFAVPQRLRVQISSGDSFFSACPPVELPRADDPSGLVDAAATGVFRPLFQTYELPVVTDTTPRVLPRTAGGEVAITGDGFVDCGVGNRIRVRLFGCSAAVGSTSVDERELLGVINTMQQSLQPVSPLLVFVRDVPAACVSSTTLRIVLPPRLATYKLFYRVSVDDGSAFSLATPRSRILLYSADAVEPRGGPVSGNTYVAVHGTNLHTCMALGGLVPLVKLTWMRGAKELEHVVVRGEFYPPEDVVYFYTPQSKFGLQNITLHVEVSLAATAAAAATDLPVASTGTAAAAGAGGGSGTSIATTTPFGHDEIPFVVYRTPTIKAVAPLQALVCGLSTLDLIVQGLDDKATNLLKSSIKARFKRRGQMQIADVHVHNGPGGSNEGKLTTVVPRFMVGSAAATEIPSVAAAAASSPTRASLASVRSTGTSTAAAKLWTRNGAVFVVLLRARNLLVGKKSSTCNPFVVVHCNKAQLKSTRKDGTSAPVWNELFDFDWRSEKELPHAIRLSVENQVTSDQSELLGQVTLGFADGRDLAQPFCVRAWLPLRKTTARGVAATAGDGTPGKRVDAGDVEVAVAYVPMPVKKAVAGPKFLQAAALKSTIMSAMQQQKKAGTAAAAAGGGQHPQETPRARKERLLRAFRRQGAPPSLVPSELLVELAVNGQDFLSSAPSRCLLVPTPVVLSSEPAFICMSGGTPLTITGVNFVQSGALRVAFAVSDKPGVLDSKRVAVVEAKYRSAHCISCVTPPLQTLGATEASLVNIVVSTNGLDFDSIALPVHNVAVVPAPDERRPTPSETVGGDAGPRPQSLLGRPIRAQGDSYVIDSKALHVAPLGLHAEGTPSSSSASPPMHPLQHHARVYLRPAIQRVRPADGVYTSLLVIEGRDFSDTGVATARYCSKKETHDVRTSRVTVVSAERMECAMPDFPRGTVVTMSIAMNGLEFAACPGELEVFQSPRLKEVVPNWISVASSVKQDVRLLGVNLTTKASASGSVQVSFQRGDANKVVVKGQCVDGEVLCAVPKELMTVAAVTEDTDKSLVLSPSIFIDVWLGGTHKTFTGRPLELHLYRETPEVTVVSPTNGPIYGRYVVTIEGSGFINTGKIVARFHALQELVTQRTATAADSSTGANHPPSPLLLAGAAAASLRASPLVTFVDAPARFVAEDRVVCSAPSFPQEGVYGVSVALNGVDFDTLAASRRSSTWFVAWQNWQRRKQLTAQRLSLEMALRPASAVDEPLPLVGETPLLQGGSVLPTTPASSILLRPPTSPRPSTVETAFGRRATSSRPGDPHFAGGDDLAGGDGCAPRRRLQRQQRLLLEKLVDDENREHVQDHFVDVRLLQWHPATTDDKSRSLVALLTDLFNAPETQQIMIRRLGFVFRVRGARDAGSGQYAIGSPAAFASALRLVFPHAPDRQCDELWRALDPTQLGVVSLQSIARRLVTIESPRPRSPEPGPTHYSPSYAVIEPKPPVPLILPQSAAPPDGDGDAGLPSELFMNYDAFKAVRPRVAGGAFLKREIAASWCNPVRKEKLFQVDTDEELERTFAEQQQHQQQAQQQHKPRARRLGSLAAAAAAQRPPADGGSAAWRRAKWKPDFAQHTRGVFPEKGQDEEDEKGEDEEEEDEEEDGEPRASGAVSRGERLARAAAANETKTSAAKAGSARGAAPAAATPPPFGRLAGRSILHDDIAPPYLNFLRSKEVTRVALLDE